MPSRMVSLRGSDTAEIMTGARNSMAKGLVTPPVR